MTSKMRIALFIDAENASVKHLPDYLELCRRLGKPTIARCYGGDDVISNWRKAMQDNYILPRLTPPSAEKKNASDFALIIDAVSLLHRDMFDHAVIASGDADFIQLAMHIRDNGKGVDGIGEAAKAKQHTRNAFDHFTILSNAELEKAAAKKTTTIPAKKTTPPVLLKGLTYKEELLQSFDKLSQDGPVNLAGFGKAFKQHHPNINLGKGKLKKSLLAAGLDVNDKQEVTRTASPR